MPTRGSAHQEVSLPGRFVVLVPNSSTYGISKRLPDDERKRLRKILDKAKPSQHGVIVRTAAQNITAEEIQRDVARLLRQWDQIEALAAKQTRPGIALPGAGCGHPHCPRGVQRRLPLGGD